MVPWLTGLAAIALAVGIACPGGGEHSDKPGQTTWPAAGDLGTLRARTPRRAPSVSSPAPVARFSLPEHVTERSPLA